MEISMLIKCILQYVCTIQPQLALTESKQHCTQSSNHIYGECYKLLWTEYTQRTHHFLFLPQKPYEAWSHNNNLTTKSSHTHTAI